MKKNNLIAASLLAFSFGSSGAFAAEAKIYVDGVLQKDLKHVFVNQVIKVVAKSTIKPALTVQGKLGTANSPEKNGREITLEYKVTKADLKREYIILEAWFKRADGKIEQFQSPIADSFIQTIPVTTLKQVKKLDNETDEQKLKRVLKELGLDKVNCNIES